MPEAREAFKSWVILELLGHRRLSGLLTEQELGGTNFLRIDVFPGDSTIATATQFYSAAAVYCITPTTEAIARKLAANEQPAPVTEWDLRPERTLAAQTVPNDDEYPV